MTAKNPHSSASVRNQWTAQRMASRQGADAVPSVIPGFDAAPEPLGSSLGSQASPAPKAAKEAPAPAAASMPSIPTGVAQRAAASAQKSRASARPQTQAERPAPAQASAGVAPTSTPLPKNPMVAAHLREQQERQQRQTQAATPARTPRKSQAESGIPTGRQAIDRHLQGLSPQARQYSRYATGHYALGGAAASTGAYAPAEGILPFAVYGIASVALTLLWCVWTKLSIDGSVMGSSLHFSAGLAIFFLTLAAGVVLGAVVSVLSRNKGDMPVSTAVALSFGKTAVAMLVAVVVWFVVMLYAAG